MWLVLGNNPSEAKGAAECGVLKARERKAFKKEDFGRDGGK